MQSVKMRSTFANENNYARKEHNYFCNEELLKTRKEISILFYICQSCFTENLKKPKRQSYVHYSFNCILSRFLKKSNSTGNLTLRLSVAFLYVPVWASTYVVRRLFFFHFLLLQALMFSTMGAILCCTAGLILIRDWDNFSGNLIHAYLQEYSDQTVAAGSFAILAALVFALDTYFINKNDWSPIDHHRRKEWDGINRFISIVLLH